MSYSKVDILLTVEDLKVYFTKKRPSLFRKGSKIHAVDGVSFEVRKGTTFGLVGESGSGKTTTALAIVKLVRLTSGRINLGGVDIQGLNDKLLRKYRRNMQIVFQDPYSSLNPRLRAGGIVRQPLDRLNVGDISARDARVDELFKLVGLLPEHKVLFPHQFSGGQRQRIGIARALATQPDLIVCDEPVSALDVAIQAQILNLLDRLQKDFGLTYLFISHDLGVIQHMCDEIAVMYAGRIVEKAKRIELFSEPLHPYTWALLSAIPSASADSKSRAGRIRLEGDPPSPIDPTPGCAFASRCPCADLKCSEVTPVLKKTRKEHWVACHLVDANGVAQYVELNSFENG